MALLFTLLPVIGLTYGRSGLWCWIDGDKPLGILWFWLTFYAPLWVVIIAVIAIYLVISIFMIFQRKKFRELTQGNTDMVARDVKVYMKLFGYPLVFLLVWLFPTINRLYQSISDDFSFTLVILHATFDQLQGFLNCLLFFLNPVEGEHVVRDFMIQILVCCRCRSSVEEEVRFESDLKTDTDSEMEIMEQEVTRGARSNSSTLVPVPLN
jgi:heme/copper-type cytochrome/quinol oxidase subunit 2